MDKCIACGMCAEKCPKKVLSEYDEGLTKRKAAYVKYAQAVPLKYVIDPDECIYLQKGKCRACEKFCPADAIKFDDERREHTIDVGAVILATGCEAYDPRVHDVYGYGKSPDIVTSLEFERILSSSGPYGGHLVRPSDKKEPRNIAWLQCIGSRDTHTGAKNYCSAICCTQAIKEAMLAKEHCKGQMDATIFYIDIRTYGKDFERYYNRAKDELGVRFVKSRITYIEPLDEEGRHMIRYVDEQGRRVEEAFDMVVLSVGLGIGVPGEKLARLLDLDLDHYHFIKTGSFEPVQTSTPGIYACGTCESPKDIPSSVVDASAAAGVAGSRLAASRWTLTKTEETPKEIDVRGEPVRIGVFVCCCGTNIAGIVDVPSVVEYAQGLPGVVYAEENLFSCAQDTQDKMGQVIKEKKLNRVVVAACTPKTHEPVFRETLIKAGINPYLFEKANIRNQCSWVHADNQSAATEKSKDLVRMTVAKVALLEPLHDPILDITQQAMVVGGGLAGLAAAINLGDQGYHTYLVEKDDALGGQARHIFQTWRGEDVQEQLTAMVQKALFHRNIEVCLNSQITAVEGFVGNFKSEVTIREEARILEHGVTVIATGASELQPTQYLYGKDPRVITGLELQKRFVDNDPSLDQVKTAVFVQCVGSRIPDRRYCSKICCTQSIQAGLKLKEINPQMHIYVLYRSMRPYGLREDLYREARSNGIAFVRYDFDKDFSVNRDNQGLEVGFTDRVLKRKMEIRPDLLVLASAIVPEKENPLAQFFKVPRNDDGFFAEAHVKLRPVDFATEGVFVCGLAHAPKSMDESIAQGQAAAARAVNLLSAKTIPVSGTVAQVDPSMCSECGICVSVCPFLAPKFNEKTGKAEVEPTLCKGCGLCVASCRSGAIHLKGFDNAQIMAMIEQTMYPVK